MISQSFYACRSYKCKKDSKVIRLFFALSGSVHIKAAHKMLMKLTPNKTLNRTFTCENEDVFHVPDLDEVVRDEGGGDDDQAVPGDGDQPFHLLQHLGTQRLGIATFAPSEVFQFLQIRLKIV